MYLHVKYTGEMPLSSDRGILEVPGSPVSFDPARLALSGDGERRDGMVSGLEDNESSDTAVGKNLTRAGYA